MQFFISGLVNGSVAVAASCTGTWLGVVCALALVLIAIAQLSGAAVAYQRALVVDGRGFGAALCAALSFVCAPGRNRTYITSSASWCPIR